MQLNFHGELARRFGPSFTMEASSIVDAIEGFSRQAGAQWPSDTRVVVVGYNTAESMMDCPHQIDLMPALQGGSGKFTNILIGVAMIGLAVATGGLSLGATGLVATALGSSLAISGALMILQGVVGLFMKAPKITKSQDPEASKYLALNKNTTAVNTPITMAWGRIDLGGQWLSLQSDSNNLTHGAFPATPT
jgi:predicted phage tail protein